uniref:Uncharacterized protein n=1 Tax=Setaria italica TaxID=4555 RepID=K3Y0T3_SETIT
MTWKYNSSEQFKKSKTETHHYYKLGLACNRTRTVPISCSDEASTKILTGYLQMQY